MIKVNGGRIIFNHSGISSSLWRRVFPCRFIINGILCSKYITNSE